MDAATTAKITFTETKVVDDERKGTDREERYEEGKTYELSLRSADRWVKRGVAVFATEEDQINAAGASSDVSLRLQDSDRFDPSASRVPPVGTGEAKGQATATGDGDKLKYEDMKSADLKAELERRNIPVGDAKKNADLVKLLERDDAVSAAIEAKDWEVLHVDELKERADAHGVDITEAHSKAELVAAYAKVHPKTA